MSPASPDHSVPWEPDLPAADDWSQQFPISETAKYVQRIAIDQYERLVDWAVMQMRLIDGEWREVVRYDCAEGKGLHRHLFDRRGVQFDEQPIWPVKSCHDLEKALNYAVDQVVEHWQEHERRSDRGR